MVVEEMRKMANDISTMIQLEEDYPSKYDDKKLPLLDLKVEVKAIERAGMPKSCKLYYYYYRKPMSNWILIPENSALAMSVKRTPEHGHEAARTRHKVGGGAVGRQDGRPDGGKGRDG